MAMLMSREHKHTRPDGVPPESMLFAQKRRLSGRLQRRGDLQPALLESGYLARQLPMAGAQPPPLLAGRGGIGCRIGKARLDILLLGSPLLEELLDFALLAAQRRQPVAGLGLEPALLAS